MLSITLPNIRALILLIFHSVCYYYLFSVPLFFKFLFAQLWLLAIWHFWTRYVHCLTNHKKDDYTITYRTINWMPGRQRWSFLLKTPSNFNILNHIHVLFQKYIFKISVKMFWIPTMYLRGTDSDGLPLVFSSSQVFSFLITPFHIPWDAAF